MAAITRLNQTIQTTRLFLRPVQWEDWWDLYRCVSDSAVMKYEPFLTEEQRRKWADDCISSNGFWSICLAGTGRMIGSAYLGNGGQDNWEIGYMLKAQYQKQGYATEAICPLVGRAFDIETAHRVYAFCNAENTASWQLLDRLGFRREGLIKQNVYLRQGQDGKPVWQDTLIYGLLKEEWMGL